MLMLRDSLVSITRLLLIILIFRFGRVGFVILEARNSNFVDVLVHFFKRIVDALDLLAESFVKVIVIIISFILIWLLDLGEGGRLSRIDFLMRWVLIDCLVQLLDGIVVSLRRFDHFLVRFLDFSALLLVGLADCLGVLIRLVVVILGTVVIVVSLL